MFYTTCTLEKVHYCTQTKIKIEPLLNKLHLFLLEYLFILLLLPGIAEQFGLRIDPAPILEYSTESGRVKQLARKNLLSDLRKLSGAGGFGIEKKNDSAEFCVDSFANKKHE